MARRRPVASDWFDLSPSNSERKGVSLTPQSEGSPLNSPLVGVSLTNVSSNAPYSFNSTVSAVTSVAGPVLTSVSSTSHAEFDHAAISATTSAYPGLNIVSPTALLFDKPTTSAMIAPATKSATTEECKTKRIRYHSASTPDPSHPKVRDALRRISSRINYVQRNSHNFYKNDKIPIPVRRIHECQHRCKRTALKGITFLCPHCADKEIEVKGLKNVFPKNLVVCNMCNIAACNACHRYWNNHHSLTRPPSQKDRI